MFGLFVNIEVERIGSRTATQNLAEALKETDDKRM